MLNSSCVDSSVMFYVRISDTLPAFVIDKFVLVEW